MFITVLHGDGEKCLFNPHCRTNILLEDIKRRCKCKKDATVDLSDEDGNVKNLVDHPLSYANELLKERESFVLIKIEKKGEDENVSYVPLLNNMAVVNSAFLDRLSKHENDTSSIKHLAQNIRTSAATPTAPTKKHSTTGASYVRSRAGFLASPGKTSRTGKDKGTTAVKAPSSGRRSRESK